MGMRTILLTGATGGIGAMIREALREKGDTVIGVGRADADLSSYDEIKKLSEKILAETPRFDWIICAHGFIDTETNLERQEPANIERTFAVNTLSLFFIAQLFLKSIAPEGGMVFLSSTAGINASGRFAAYSASKAAVNSFAQALARNRPELSFYSVCPGPTNTQMREKIAADANSSQPPTIVANVIGDIISGEATYASGDIIVVQDGKVSVASRLEK